MVGTDHDLGGSATDIHHQPAAVVRGKIVRCAQVNQSCLFSPRDDVDGHAEYTFRPPEKIGGIAGGTQGVGTHHADAFAGDIAQAFGDPGETVQGALLGSGIQLILFIQAGCKAHHVLVPVQYLHFAAGEARDKKMEAVRTKVERSVKVGRRRHDGTGGGMERRSVAMDCAILSVGRRNY